MNKLLDKRLLIIIAIIFSSILLLYIKLDSLSSMIFSSRYRGSYNVSAYYEFFLGLLTFISLTLLIMLFSAKNKKILAVWFVKAFVTLILMIFYEAYYGLDAYVYAFRAFAIDYTPVFGKNNTENIIYINHLFTYLVGNSYYSLKMFNSFIGFLGLIFLYKSYEYTIQKSNLKLDDKFIYIFFLFPSILFWSSILGKDPLNLFFVGMFVYGFIHIIDEFKLRYVVMIVLSVWFVSYIRSWYTVIMITSMFLYFIKLNSVRNFIFFLLLLPIFVVIGQQFLQTQGIDSINILFLKMTETTQKLAYGKSAVSTFTITGFGDYLLYYIPNLFTTLFRPMPWDIRNPFTLMAAVENTILLYLSYKYIFKNWKNIYSNKYLKFLILFVFSWSLLYVIISPANLGGAARFKLQVLPAMIMLIGAAMAMQKRTEEAKEKEVVSLAK